jgi:outer membrane protein assembly factor BamB
MSSPAVPGGVVYVGSIDWHVYALDAATGSLRRTYTAGDSINSSPAVAGGTVYVGCNDGKVYALDAATGSLRWTYTTPGQIYSSPAVAGGTVYVGSEDGRVYALDAATGSLRWTYTIGGQIDSSPAASSISAAATARCTHSQRRGLGLTTRWAATWRILSFASRHPRRGQGSPSCITDCPL